MFDTMFLMACFLAVLVAAEGFRTHNLGRISITTKSQRRCLAARGGKHTWTKEDSARVGVFETEFNPALATLPLVLLDIDGVVNRVEHDEPDEAWPDEFSRDIRFPLRLSPTVINFFNEISRSGVAEIRWLTTWDAKAQALAPKIGFDDFLLAREPARDTGKSEAALELALRYPDRPICWLDDEVGYYVRSRKLESFWEQVCE